MKLNGKVIFAFTGIFIAGMVTGGFVGVSLAKYYGPKPMTAEQFMPQQMKKFTEQLGLTAEQREKIKPILEQASNEMKPIRKEAFKAISEILERMEAAVAKELTDAQRKRLGEIQAHESERRKQWMNDRAKQRGDRPPGPGGDEPPRGPPPPDKPVPPAVTPPAQVPTTAAP